LAAILTTCGNYWIESHKARLNYQVELAKARLQNQEIELTARRTAYDALDRELADLGKDLAGYVATCRMISQRPGSRGYQGFAAQSWNRLTDQLGSVSKAEADSNRLNNDQDDIGSEVEAITGTIGVNLFSDEVQKHKHDNPELARKHDDLQHSITTARTHISQKIAALTLQAGQQP